MRIFLSLLLFIFINLTLYFTSSYEFINADNDYYLINHYELFYDLTHQIKSISSLNIINAIFIAKIITLSPIIIIFAFIYRKTPSIDYYSLSTTIFIFIFLSIFFISNQNQKPKMNTFHSDKLKQEVFIPSLKPREYNIKNYHIFLILSFIALIFIRRFIASPFLVLILLPSILMSLYHIYTYKNYHLPIINSDIIDINNSLIISLKRDEERLKYHFKNNIFISDDYILSDIISHYNHKILNKSLFYLKYFDSNNTMKNILTKGNKTAQDKDIFIYTNKNTFHNLYSIFQLASYDIIKNKASDILVDIDFITNKLDTNMLYHKSITKNIYKTSQAIFNLSKGILTINNKKMPINNAFLVNKKVQKIQYNNNSKSKIIAIIIDEKYMLLCHQEYIKSFFIQALIFKNYSNPFVSSVYDKKGVKIIKITNPTKK